MRWFPCRPATTWLLLLLVWFAALPAAAAEDPGSASLEARQAGLRLVREGRYEQAIWTAGAWADLLRRELLSEIDETRREGNLPRALSLYRSFFRYYPFGDMSCHSGWTEWDTAAAEYVALRQAQQEPWDNDAAMEAAALEIYRRLAQHHQAFDKAKCEPLADEIVARYPRSMFAPAAALAVGHIAEQHGGGAEAAVAVYERYIAALRKADAPARSVLLLLLAQAYDCARSPDKPELLSKGLDIYQTAGGLAEIDYEKKSCLLRSAQVAATIGDRESLVLSRTLFRQFLAKYPGATESDEALRGFEKTLPGDRELAKELFTAAQTRFKAGEYQAALTYLQEIVDRFPQNGFAPLAYLGLGETYEKLGDDEKMLAAYKQAAQLPRSPTATSIMDASDSRNRASEWLARYYMGKQDWSEALRWWSGWKPASWCGTCEQSMEARRAENIAVCLAHLGRHGEAAQTCLDFLMAASPGGETPSVALLVARLYREAGQTADLMKMVDQFEETKLREFEEKGLWNGLTREKKLAYLPTWPIRESVRIAQLAEQGDVDALAAVCKATRASRIDIFADPGRDWPCKEAAEALAGMGDRGVEAAGKLANSSEYCGAWPIYALGRSPSPKALEALRARARTERGPNANNVASAIALHGEAGKALLAELAALPTTAKNYGMHDPAKRRLENLDSGRIGLTPAWPPPKPGSLPKTR